MKQSITAPPPRPWSKTEGYVEASRENSSNRNQLSGSSAGDPHTGNRHARRSSTDSQDQEDATVGVDPAAALEPLQIQRTTDYVWQNINMNKEQLRAFALKSVSYLQVSPCALY
jgi:hypothetical protein